MEPELWSSDTIEYRHLYCATQGCSVAQTEHRAMTLQQLDLLSEFATQELDQRQIMDTNEYSATRGERITLDILNMYHMCDYFVKRLTRAFQCSFMELVADGPQPPLWYVLLGAGAHNLFGGCS